MSRKIKCKSKNIIVRFFHKLIGRNSCECIIEDNPVEKPINKEDFNKKSEKIIKKLTKDNWLDEYINIMKSPGTTLLATYRQLIKKYGGISGLTMHLTDENDRNSKEFKSAYLHIWGKVKGRKSGKTGFNYSDLLKLRSNYDMFIVNKDTKEIIDIKKLDIIDDFLKNKTIPFNKKSLNNNNSIKYTINNLSNNSRIQTIINYLDYKDLILTLKFKDNGKIFILKG